MRGFVQVGMCVVCTLVVEAEPEPDRWSLGVGEAQVANAVPLQNISFFFSRLQNTPTTGQEGSDRC